MPPLRWKISHAVVAWGSNHRHILIFDLGPMLAGLPDHLHRAPAAPAGQDARLPIPVLYAAPCLGEQPEVPHHAVAAVEIIERLGVTTLLFRKPPLRTDTHFMASL